MIDNPLEVSLLMTQMKECLPLRAIMTKRLLTLFKEHSPSVAFPDECEIIDIHYGGDDGGILCALKFEGLEKDEIYVCSLTHLHFYKNMPLSMEIHTYQKHRVRALKKANAYEPHNGSVQEITRDMA